MGAPNEKAMKAWKRADAERMETLRVAALNSPYNDLSRFPSRAEIEKWQEANRKVEARVRAMPDAVKETQE